MIYLFLAISLVVAILAAKVWKINKKTERHDKILRNSKP